MMRTTRLYVFTAVILIGLVGCSGEKNPVEPTGLGVADIMGEWQLEKMTYTRISDNTVDDVTDESVFVLRVLNIDGTYKMDVGRKVAYLIIDGVMTIENDVVDFHSIWLEPADISLSGNNLTLSFIDTAQHQFGSGPTENSKLLIVADR